MDELLSQYKEVETFRLIIVYFQSQQIRSHFLVLELVKRKPIPQLKSIVFPFPIFKNFIKC